jgi:acetyltransferase-like isoleucine patch superfamily enzyme
VLDRNNLLRTLAGVGLRAVRRGRYRSRLQRLKRAGLKANGIAFVHARAMLEAARFIELGEGCVIGEAVLYALDRIVIGRHVVINDGVFLCTATHDADDASFPLRTGPITIGDYAWIATRSIVLPGVSIGRGAIVGAGAVVTRDVAPMTVVAGNPAREVGSRKVVHNDQVTERLASADPMARLREYRARGT